MTKILKTFNVTDTWLSECNDYQSMFTGIDLTPEQMLEIFTYDQYGRENNYLLLESLADFETGRRECFMNQLSEKLISSDWPCGMNKGEPKYKDFYPRLYQAAKATGYKVTESK